VAWYDYKNVAYAFQAFPNIRAHREVVGERDTRQVTLVLSILDHLFEQVELDDTAKSDVTTGARKLKRERRSPGTGADNRNCFCSAD
jgi:hypothetical protein